MIEWSWFDGSRVSFGQVSVMRAISNGAYVQEVIPFEIQEILKSDLEYARTLIGTMAERMERMLREFMDDPVARDAML